MGSVIQDIRYAIRQLRRSPIFTAAAVGTLALGIGAGTALFSVGDAALLRPLRVSEPDRVVLVHLRTPEGGDAMNVSQPLLRGLREATAGALSGLVGVAPRELSLRTGEGSVPIEAEVVSPGYFDVLGARLRLGPGFPPEASEAPVPVVVLSEQTWRRRFGADPDVIGRSVRLNDRALEVVGVAPAGFRGIIRGRSAEAWVPLSMQPALGSGQDWAEEPGVRWLYAIGRLAPGITPEGARAALAPLPDRLVAAGAGLAPGEGLALRSIPVGYTGWIQHLADPLLALGGLVALVLLIACANVANLLLARGAGRVRELAVRRSLGAGRARIARQLMTESLLISALGGVAGVALGVWGADLLTGLQVPLAGDGWAPDVRLDARVLAFALATTTVTGLLFGLAPAVGGARRDPAADLRGGTAPKAPSRRVGLSVRDTLVVGQVALSLVLLLGAGLFLRTLHNLRAVDPGYAARDVLLVDLDLETAGYAPEAGRAFYDRLLERVAALPGVEAASLASTVTPQAGGSNMGGVDIVDRQLPPGEEVSFDVVVVGPGHFATLDMPLLRGVPPEEADLGGEEVPVVVNAWMAERYWDGRALGGRLRTGDGEAATTYRIVGVAASGKYRSLREEPRAMVYLPLARAWDPALTLLARTPGGTSALAREVRAVVAGLDAAVPVGDVRTLTAHLDRATATERLSARLGAAFAGLALLLATVGLYGVLSYRVSRRTREIGIRMAVGARRADVVRLFLGRGARLLATGVVLGAAAGLLLARGAEGLLYGIAPFDPWSLLAAIATLMAAGLAASWIPSRRAAAADAASALRRE